MGLLRSLAHTIFGFLLLTALWVTALSFLSMRGPSTAVITDLGVDALNPWLVTKHIGLDTTAYTKLEQFASANPGKPLPLTFIKPQIMSSDIKGLPYAQGVRLIYSRVADAYYTGGPAATFSLPAPVAGAVQTFALFPQQYDAAVKAAPLPTWLQPFLLYTGLAPDSLTASGHARIADMLPKFWMAALLFAGVIFLLNILGRRNPVSSLALAAWHGAWPTLAVFGILWLIGTLYPARVQSVAAAFGVVAGSFLPVYGVAAAAGIGVYLVSRFAGSMAHSFGKRPAPAKVPAPAAVRAGYTTHPDDTPSYTPGGVPSYPAARPSAARPSTGRYQPGGQQDAGWTPPARQPWEQPAPPARQPWEQPAQPAPPAQPGWGAAQPQDPRQPSWNQPRPWDAPDPSEQHYGDQGGSWGQYRQSGPDDPTAPRW